LRAGIALAVALALAGVFAIARRGSGNAVADAQLGVKPPSHETRASRAAPTPSTSSSSATSTSAPREPARDFVLREVATIRGDIAPKSVTATGTGLVFAQNMMYRHTMTVYDAATTALVRTIPDGVDLTSFGVRGHPGLSRGAPVEAAVDAAHKDVFATNYSMYGAGFGPEGSDTCRGPSGLSRSFIYRVSLGTLAIDGVGEVGMVPKYVAVTPDDKYVLVSNWCSYDLSVLDHDSLHEVRRIHLGAYPRGIAVDGAKQVAYVAVMGSFDIARIDLRTFALSYFRGVGNSPRHLVLSKDGRRLFVTLNGDNRVAAVDTADGEVVARTSTGQRPRSMAISADGLALYVVNYSSNTVSVLRSSDLKVVHTYRVPDHPIGIAYEPTRHRVWVACYSGEILVYDV
jgi:YVTN family beta-propeller protein